MNMNTITEVGSNKWNILFLKHLILVNSVPPQHSYWAVVLVGCSYPGVEALWNVVCSRNLARLLSTCYNNSYRRRGFNRDRRQRHLLAGLWYLRIRFFTCTWTPMAPLFGQVEEGDSPYAMFKSALFEFLSKLIRTDVKAKVIQVPMGSLKTSIMFHNLYLQPLPLTYELAPPQDCSYHWYLFFFFSNPWMCTCKYVLLNMKDSTLNNIRSSWNMVSLYAWTPP